MRQQHRIHLTFLAATLVALPTLAAEPSEAHVQAAERHLQTQKSGLKMDEQYTFRLQAHHTDHLGLSHSRFQQLFHGLRVIGGDAIVHTTREGGHIAQTDKLHPGIHISTHPTLGDSEALAIAHADFAPKGDYAYTPTAELVVLPITREVLRPERRHVHLAKANAEDMTRVTIGHRLVYLVKVATENAADGFQEVLYTVDAHSGAIIGKRSNLHTAGVKGTGNSQYSGAVTLDTNSTSTGFELRDTTRGIAGSNPRVGGTGLGNSTYNLDHMDGTQDYTNIGTIYTTSDNTWGDGTNYVDGGSTTNLNGQTAAVDAHYGLQVTWDFYSNVLGRNGIDGQGSATHNRLHSGTNFVNAFWSDACFCMTYGDGNASRNASVITAIDVAGHEMSHGVCANTANLNYGDFQNGVGTESGGLNESNSDIFGTMVEFYKNGGGYSSSATTVPATGGNWTIGEQLMPSPLRYMYKPSLDGISPDAWYAGMSSDPNFASQAFPNGGDPHLTSGPMNRCFFFLSQGASGDASSDTYSSYLPGGMTGIGNDEAARIWYRTLSTYLTSGSQYTDARTGAIQSAQDLYGAGSVEEQAVWNAFAAINVGTAWGQ